MYGFKVFLLILLLALAVAVDSARLLRVPRIYNALITSDEMLIPSQAYPAVAPVLRPAAFPSPSLYLAPAYGNPPSPYKPVNFQKDLPPVERQPQQPSEQQSVLFDLPSQQTVPVISDQIKNNKPANPDIPDVPPPPVPVSPPRNQNDNEAQQKRRPSDYPPMPQGALPFLR